MNHKTNFSAKFFVLLILPVFLLSACKKAIESPSEVLLNAKQASMEVKSGEVEVSASVDGNNGVDDLKFEGDLNVTFDNNDLKNRKIDLQLVLSGLMSAADKSFNGDLDLQFTALEGQYYIKINNLQSNDPTITQMQPFLEQYKAKWLRLAEDFIPPEIRNLQQEDEATKLKRNQLEGIFLETELFKVTKEYGVEKLSGNNVYHYALTVQKDAFADYMHKAAIIDGRELTDAEVQEAIAILDYIQEVEVYINTESYHLHKAVLRFSGAVLNQEASLDITVNITTDKLGQKVEVTTPESSEEFNPLSLVMGLGTIAPESQPDEAGSADVVEETEENN